MNGVKISDHLQSATPRPLRGSFLMPPALLVVADLRDDKHESSKISH